MVGKTSFHFPYTLIYSDIFHIFYVHWLYSISPGQEISSDHILSQLFSFSDRTRAGWWRKGLSPGVKYFCWGDRFEVAAAWVRRVEQRSTKAEAATAWSEGGLDWVWLLAALRRKLDASLPHAPPTSMAPVLSENDWQKHWTFDGNQTFEG